MAKRQAAKVTPVTPVTPVAKAPARRAVVNTNTLAASLVSVPVAPVAPVVTQVASVAIKLTKRNNTQVGTTLVATAKVPKSRAPHVKAAWQAVLAALPATATTLCALPPLAHPQCVSPQAFVSYMLRRGHLMPKA
jgi:hypothetical protein